MKKGYSFLEVMVYTSILAAIFSVCVASVLSIYGGLNKIKTQERLSNNGEFFLEKIVRDIRSATSTNTLISVFGTNPGVLQIGSVKYSLSSYIIQRQEGLASPENITSNDVKVTNLVFFRDFSQSSKVNSEIVKVELTLDAGSGKFQKSKKFFTSGVLRGEDEI
jgi:hypothetical protein